MIPVRDTFGTIRTVSSETDVATRLRVAHAAGVLSLDAGLAPAEVLLVRSIRHRAPGTWGFSTGVRFREWQEGFSSNLRAARRAATRPLDGRVRRGANAILFEDRAELLACLAVAITRGTAWSSWWCELLLPRFGTPRASPVATAWMEAPKLVPAILDCLASWSEVEKVMQGLRRDECVRLVCAMAEAHGVPSIAAAVEGRLALGKPRDLGQARTPGAGRRSDRLDYGLGKPVSTRAPDERTIRRLFVMSGLALYREPAVARDPAFALALARARAGLGPVPRNAEIGAQWMTRPLSWGPRGGRDPAADRPSADLPGQSRKIDSVGEGSAGIRAAIGAGETGPTKREEPRSPSPSGWTREPSTAAEQPAGGVSTAAAGVLQLVNFLQPLELLEGFASRFPVACALRGWGIVELLGRCLAPVDSSDPIWKALASLDGREGEEPPDLQLKSGPVYGLPSEWLEGFAASPREEWVGDSCCEYWCADGFPVVAQYLPGDFGQVGTGEESRLPALGPQYSATRAATLDGLPFGLTTSQPLGRLLVFLVPYLRARLVRTLSVGSPIDEEALRDFFGRPGTLHVGRTHVDLVMSLNDISLPARLSGLDRNPGWVPALGRVITYHFA